MNTSGVKKSALFWCCYYPPYCSIRSRSKNTWTRFTTYADKWANIPQFGQRSLDFPHKLEEYHRKHYVIIEACVVTMTNTLSFAPLHERALVKVVRTSWICECNFYCFVRIIWMRIIEPWIPEKGISKPLKYTCFYSTKLTLKKQKIDLE